MRLRAAGSRAVTSRIRVSAPSSVALQVVQSRLELSAGAGATGSTAAASTSCSSCSSNSSGRCSSCG